MTVAAIFRTSFVRTHKCELPFLDIHISKGGSRDDFRFLRATLSPALSPGLPAEYAGRISLLHPAMAEINQAGFARQLHNGELGQIGRGDAGPKTQPGHGQQGHAAPAADPSPRRRFGSYRQTSALEETQRAYPLPTRLYPGRVFAATHGRESGVGHDWWDTRLLLVGIASSVELVQRGADRGVACGSDLRRAFESRRILRQGRGAKAKCRSVLSGRSANGRFMASDMVARSAPHVGDGLLPSHTIPPLPSHHQTGRMRWTDAKAVSPHTMLHRVLPEAERRQPDRATWSLDPNRNTGLLRSPHYRGIVDSAIHAQHRLINQSVFFSIPLGGFYGHQ